MQFGTPLLRFGREIAFCSDQATPVMPEQQPEIKRGNKTLLIPKSTIESPPSGFNSSGNLFPTVTF